MCVCKCVCVCVSVCKFWVDGLKSWEVATACRPKVAMSCDRVVRGVRARRAQGESERAKGRTCFVPLHSDIWSPLIIISSPPPSHINIAKLCLSGFSHPYSHSHSHSHSLLHTYTIFLTHPPTPEDIYM